LDIDAQALRHGPGDIDIQPNEITVFGRGRHGGLLPAGPDDQLPFRHDAVQHRSGSGIHDRKKCYQADNHEANGGFTHGEAPLLEKVGGVMTGNETVRYAYRFCQIFSTGYLWDGARGVRRFSFEAIGGVLLTAIGGFRPCPPKG
jgi:hypothetical protein